MTKQEGYEFSLILSQDDIDDDTVNALYEAGCDDALVAVRNCQVSVNFTRYADSLQAAVLSAIKDARQTGVVVASVSADKPADELDTINAWLAWEEQARGNPQLADEIRGLGAAPQS